MLWSAFLVWQRAYHGVYPGVASLTRRQNADLSEQLLALPVKSVISLRLEPETVETIDDLVGQKHRSEFIRDAVDKALEGVEHKPVNNSAPKKEKRAVQQPKKQGKSVVQDGQRLLSIVPESGISARKAREDLGWTEMRFSLVERALLNLDLISSVSGYLYRT